MNEWRQYAKPMTKTVEEIIAEQRVFTDAQRSLAWMPEPPIEHFGGPALHGVFECETLHEQWARARYRWMREERQ